MSTPQVHVEVWSDIACPWCYVGERRLQKALAALKESRPSTQVQVSWRSFIIDPQTQREGEPYLAYNERRWGSDGWTRSLRQSGRPDGAMFADWRTWPNTLLAHQLVKLTDADGGRGQQAVDAIFQHTYERGGNSSSLEELVGLAGELGLDPAAARQALKSGAKRDEVMRDIAYAKRVLNITGVPQFIISNDGRAGEPAVLRGAVSTSSLLAAMERQAQS